IQVFGTSALFRQIGVPLAAAVSPVIYLLGLAGLSLRTSLPAGVGAMAGTTLQDHAVSDPAQRILLTLFPERLRATVTALVVEAPRSRAVATLARALGVAPPANRRLLITALDRILEDKPVLSTSAAQQVAALLAAPEGLDPIDRANLVQAYARLLGAAAAEPGWRGILEEAARDEREPVRLAGVAAICRLERCEDLERVLVTALESDDATTRQIVREELRAELLRRDAEPESADAIRHLQHLAARLAHPDDRPHAARALADVAERYGGRVAAQAAVLLPYRDHHDVRVRTAVLRSVGASHLDTEARWAATRLGAPDVAEAAAAQGA